MEEVAAILTSGTECDLRENFASNKYTNIFVSKKLHERMSEYLRMKNLTRTNVRINICIENGTNIQIYLNIRMIFTLYHTHEPMSEYIRSNKFNTNECPNISLK